MREPKILVATGKRGVGKTYTTTQKLIRAYVHSDPSTGKKGRKVLIYDANEEYVQFKALLITDIKRFMRQDKIEVRRILPRTPDGKIVPADKMSLLLNEIMEVYRGGMLLIEDINRYSTGTQTVELVGLLATNRHRDLDIVLHVQSLAAVTTRMWQNCNEVRFHKQLDDIRRYKNRIPNYQLFRIAECLVNYKVLQGGEENERFFCYVSQDNNKIYGDYSLQEFQQALIVYFQKEDDVIRDAMKMFGKGYDARTKAFKSQSIELTKLYYGGN